MINKSWQQLPKEDCCKHHNSGPRQPAVYLALPCPWFDQKLVQGRLQSAELIVQLPALACASGGVCVHLQLLHLYDSAAESELTQVVTKQSATCTLG